MLCTELRLYCKKERQSLMLNAVLINTSYCLKSRFRRERERDIARVYRPDVPTAAVKEVVFCV